jgi:hypothetical protein
MMDKLKGANADTQLIFIFDCCRQPKNSAIAKGDDALAAQAAEVAINAVNKGGAGLSGLATFILFGARSFKFASDGGSAMACSVLTQAIVDTASDPSKIAQPAVMFFMDVNEQVERLGGNSMSHTEGKFKFQFAEKSATTTSAVGSATAGSTNADTKKVHALLDLLNVGKFKTNEQVVLALEMNSIFQPADLQGLSVEDLREAGIPPLAAKKIVAAAGKEEQLAPSTVEIKTKQTNTPKTVGVHTVFVVCARAVAVMVG